MPVTPNKHMDTRPIPDASPFENVNTPSQQHGFP